MLKAATQGLPLLGIPQGFRNRQELLELLELLEFGVSCAAKSMTHPCGLCTG
jgi:hypothetical protein